MARWESENKAVEALAFSLSKEELEEIRDYSDLWSIFNWAINQKEA